MKNKSKNEISQKNDSWSKDLVSRKDLLVNKLFELGTNLNLF